MPMPTPRIAGLHHVTAIATDPRRNVTFYTRTLGLRLVKKTVNFDDPKTYHLYFGDQHGHPGTILTFFPWPRAHRSDRGAGQVMATAFAVPVGSLGFWYRHLRSHGVAVDTPKQRFGRERLTFLDPDGLELQLVAAADAAVAPASGGSRIPAHVAIRGLEGVRLLLAEWRATASLLTEVLGFRAGAQEGVARRFYAGEGLSQASIDLVHDPEADPHALGAGTVHHVAWRVADDPAQHAWQEHLRDAGLEVTPVLDRSYFRSIYFREPGGVLFEIATDPPGFTRDEPLASLGETLQLPSWLEPQRAEIEAALPPLDEPKED